MADTLPDLAVVIPNYATHDLLRLNLPSVVAAADAYAGRCEVIVVDDASPEPGFDAAMREWPAIRTVQHDENRGFPVAVRSGVDASAGDLVLLLNSDVRPETGSFGVLASAFEDDSVFAVSPVIRDDDDSINPYTWNVSAFKGGRLRRLRTDASRAISEGTRRPTLFCSGGSTMIRRDRFLALGGFHPLYHPYYSEDLDLGVRAWRHGWRSLFDPSASITHAREGSIRRTQSGDRVGVVQRRNRLFFEWVHFPASRLALSVPGNILQVFTRLARGDARHANAFSEALRQLNAVSQLRGELRNLPHDLDWILDEVGIKAGSRGD